MDIANEDQIGLMTSEGGTSQRGNSEATDPGADSGILLGRDFIAAVVIFHEEVGRMLGVSPTDRKCLDLLSRGPATAGDLMRFTGLTSGAVTGIIDRLVDAGYAQRTPDASDRRRILVSRARNSRLDEVMASVFGPLGSDMASVTGRYSPGQLATIADFLARTREVLVANTQRVQHLRAGDTVSSGRPTA